MRTIELQGIALTRGVRLNGTPLAVDGLDWGFDCAGSWELSKALAKELSLTSTQREELHAAVVRCLPSGNFNVRIYLDILKAPAEYMKHGLIHGHSLMDFNVKGFWIPKFLDFPNNGVKEAILESGTLEYLLIKKLSKEELDAYLEYIEVKTHRVDSAAGTKTSAELIIAEDVIIYRNGLGSHEIKGTTENYLVPMYCDGL